MNLMRKTVLVIAGIMLLALAIIGGWYLAGSVLRPGGQAETIVVALPRLESSALLWIAADQGFFSQNGLDVTFREPTTGIAALDELLEGKVDIAATSEYPLVGKAFQKEKLLIIGCIDKGDFMFLAARRDHGIDNVSDLKGKKIGLISGTIQDFYLGRFLELNGMRTADVILVSMKSSAESSGALMNGSVDAIVVSEPIVGEVRDLLGARAVVWPVQNRQPLFGLLVCREEWAQAHPGTIIRFLDSAARAEDFMSGNPPLAKADMVRRMNTDDRVVEAAWSRNQFSLTLDQSLVLALEDEARWMIANNLTNGTEVPDFREYIYTDGLNTVKPGSVHIIG